MIILEGTDNSGKSTLARYIARELGMNIQESEGPPKYEGEINDRAKRYSLMKNTLFVRHPLVSQPIYGNLRGEDNHIDLDLILEFYDSRPLFIYCDPLSRGLDSHVVKSGESKKHLDAIKKNYDDLLTQYRKWAIQHAHIVYRIGDPMFNVLRMLRGSICAETRLI